MSVGVDRAAVAEHVNNAEQARWSAPARSTSRPLRVPKKNLSPSQPLDRDGERVIMKVVAGARNTRFLRSVEREIPKLAA
jgi:hypothetical protein